MTDTTQPMALLAGYRVLDLTSSIGALCGKLLRRSWDGRDQSRAAGRRCDARSEPPFAKGHAHREGSLRFAYLNAGKRSITLNITKPSGRNMLLDLVERADVVVEDFAPGYLASLGLGYEMLLERKKNLVLVSVSGFGQDGPYAQLQDPGYRSATPWAGCSTSAAIRR